MSSLPIPEVIITHESDLDGLVAGVLLQRLARKLHGVEAPLEAYHYNAWRQRELREKSGWITDFGFEPKMDKPNWALVDHHANEAPAKLLTLIHDLNKSAGLLCYELCREQGLISPELDRLVHLNNVADLFLEDSPDFVLACDYANLVKVYGFWNLHALIEGQIERLLDHPLLEVMAVKRRIEDPLGFNWSKAHVVPLGAGIGYVDTVVGNNNLIVFQLLEGKATNCDVLVTLFRKSNGVMIASFRSQGGQALKAAEKVQGGGHANAAGAILPKSIRNVPDAVDFLRRTFSPAAPGKTAPLNTLEHLFAGLG
jgi:oligoribonuclease NrnB/cAMP/cGMP phosphodiesterase (DHH superfamily)